MKLFSRSKKMSKKESKEQVRGRVERLASCASLPGDGNGFADLSLYDASSLESDLDVALREHLSEAKEMAEKIEARAHRTDGEHHPTADLEAMVMDTYNLKGCYFIGHTNTDMDSIACALAGAELFNGVATRSEREVNGEIEFACEYAGLGLPEYFDDIKGTSDPYNKTGIVLVDHNEPGQMIKSLGTSAFPGKDASTDDKVLAMKQVTRIKGIIDHHALSEHFATGHPLFIDIRPWGSACSIIAHMFVRLGTPIPRKISLILLCGILSDTINLTSPTTTHADKVFATLLAFLADEKHPNRLAKEMFKAKTAHLTKLSPYAVVRADQKNFQMGDYLVGWATIEVNDPEAILQKGRKLLMELRVLKKEKNLDFVFLSVCDIDKKNTKLLLCGEYEVIIAKEVFNGTIGSVMDHVPDKEESESCKHKSHGHKHETPENDSAEALDRLAEIINLDPQHSLMDIGAKISRKKDFVPPLKQFLGAGWKPTRQSIRIHKNESAPSVKTEHACVEGVGCSIERSFSPESNSQEGV